MSDGINKFAQTLISLKDANSPQCDRTLFCPIVKNNKGISTILTAEQASKLSACDEYWYYVKIQDQCFKLECKNSNFAIDEEVRVCIPCGNYERMYIDFKAGTIEDEDDGWVRPAEWGEMPELANNQIFILFRDTGELTISLYNSVEGNMATIDWGDWYKSSNIDLYNKNVSHTYTTDGYHKCVVTISGDISMATPSIRKSYDDILIHNGIIEVVVGDGFGVSDSNTTDVEVSSSIIEHIVIPRVPGVDVDYIYMPSGSVKKVEIKESLNKNIFSIGISGGFGGDVFNIGYGHHISTLQGGLDGRAFGCSTAVLHGVEGMSRLFTYGRHIKKVIAPDVKSIHGTFFMATKLKSFTFDNVSYIGTDNSSRGAFVGTALRRIIAPSLRQIAGNCFTDCNRLKYFEAPQLTYLTSFGEAKNLEEVYIPMCNRISSTPFKNCVSLKKITVKRGCTIAKGAVPPWTEIVYAD